jgi:TPP-dependent trihydroxycyclohexane-1,2-dione (THcHDO) dehydratase
MLSSDQEQPISNDPESAQTDMPTTDLEADARDALRSLQEALDGSQQLAVMIAEIEQTIADWKAQRAEDDADRS